MYFGNVIFDNSGQPDAYVVQSLCRRIRIFEHDRTASALATYNVYSSLEANPVTRLGGEEFELKSPMFNHFQIGSIPFYVETTNVASAVFDVIED